MKSLSDHIRSEHNGLVYLTTEGPTHTKVMRFQENLVVDASNCPSTLTFQVLFPEDLTTPSLTGAPRTNTCPDGNPWTALQHL
ncbi:hypothetical protein TNCT_166721 [Trichonephila clavata]|uniref:Uncharacterized protein n=1 Tax=Trichonephila clavata TaxID=2740835 RepID=A0A8X6I5G6_TRICU|nr:hypothetical protein TNCT_166721 [Trichonephila clavata]